MEDAQLRLLEMMTQAEQNGENLFALYVANIVALAKRAGEV